MHLKVCTQLVFGDKQLAIDAIILHDCDRDTYVLQQATESYKVNWKTILQSYLSEKMAAGLLLTYIFFQFKVIVLTWARLPNTDIYFDYLLVLPIYTTINENSIPFG